MGDSGFVTDIPFQRQLPRFQLSLCPSVEQFVGERAIIRECVAGSADPFICNVSEIVRIRAVQVGLLF